jgi:hypothetical protein
MKKSSSSSAIQVLISSHRELLRSKPEVVSVAETPGQDSAGTVERGASGHTEKNSHRAILFRGVSTSRHGLSTRGLCTRTNRDGLISAVRLLSL